MEYVSVAPDGLYQKSGKGKKGIIYDLNDTCYSIDTSYKTDCLEFIRDRKYKDLTKLKSMEYVRAGIESAFKPYCPYDEFDITMPYYDYNYVSDMEYDVPFEDRTYYDPDKDEWYRNGERID